jgi:hypothetical protein
MPKSTKSESTKSPSWRDVLKVHPAAELFPRMSGDELKALGEDIKKNGLKSPIVLWSPGYSGDGVKDRPRYVLDGINRLDAMELVGITTVSVPHGPLAGRRPGPTESGGARFQTEYEKEQVYSMTLGVRRGSAMSGPRVEPKTDPYAYVISANIRRRHLSSGQTDDLIVKLLKADPTKSNRAVAKLTDTSHPHVAKVRKRAEKAGDVETVTTSVDTKGRKQPAKKPRAPKPKRLSDAEINQIYAAAERHMEENAVEIGPASASAPAREDAELDELRNAKRQLEIKIGGLESEIEELRAARNKRLEQLIAERGTWEDKPLPPLNLARLPFGDQLIILMNLLQDGLTPVRDLLAALELPANASVKTRARLEGIEALVGTVFNWMSTTKDYVAEIKQALDDYAASTASTAPPDIPPTVDDGLDIPASLRRAAP